MAGAKTKLTLERQKTICNALIGGQTYEIAAHLAGIQEGTLHDWRRKGDKGRAPYAAFSKAVTRARAECERRMVANLVTIAIDGQDERNRLEATKHYLTCANPKSWAKTHKNEHTGKDGAPLLDMIEISAKLARLEK